MQASSPETVSARDFRDETEDRDDDRKCDTPRTTTALDAPHGKAHGAHVLRVLRKTDLAGSRSPRPGDSLNVARGARLCRPRSPASQDVPQARKPPGKYVERQPSSRFRTNRRPRQSSIRLFQTPFRAAGWSSSTARKTCTSCRYRPCCSRRVSAGWTRSRDGRWRHVAVGRRKRQSRHHQRPRARAAQGLEPARECQPSAHRPGHGRAHSARDATGLVVRSGSG